MVVVISKCLDNVKIGRDTAIVGSVIQLQVYPLENRLALLLKRWETVPEPVEVVFGCHNSCSFCTDIFCDVGVMEATTLELALPHPQHLF